MAKELAIGEVGVIKGTLVECRRYISDCTPCAFLNQRCEDCFCSPEKRSDGKSVIYISADTNSGANPCTWTQDDDGIWYTSCGQAQEFITGTREENGYKFCPWCGNEIQEAGK